MLSCYQMLQKRLLKCAVQTKIELITQTLNSNILNKHGQIIQSVSNQLGRARFVTVQSDKAKISKHVSLNQG
jgi:hypothetical protein